MTTENKTTAPVLIGRHHDITAFASTDTTRPMLNGVHYNADRGCLEATDGKAIAIRVPVCQQVEEFPASAGETTLTDCTIPTAAFKKAL